MAVLPKLQKKEARNVIHEAAASIRRSGDKGFVNRRMTYASGSALAVFLPTWLVLYFVHPALLVVDKDLRNFPATVENWQGEDVDKLGEPFERAADYDAVLRRVYRDPNGNSINPFIGCMGAQQQRREIHSYPKAVELENASEIKVAGETAEAIKVKSADYQVGNVAKRAIYFYPINGKIISNRYVAKIYSMLYGIVSGQTNAAVIVVSFNKKNEDLTSSEIEARDFVGGLITAVRTYMGETAVIKGVRVSS